MKTYTADELQVILRAHVAWLRNEVNGERADLRGADLRSADLRSADLRSADLRSANLRSADLRSADLRSADLRSANLHDADLHGANLGDANLRYANFRYANLGDAKELDSATMPGGYTFAAYKSDIVPALLTAGGKSLAEVVNASWDCHEWTNCPMAVAFGVHHLNDIPPRYREQARMFVQLFDQGLLPRPYVAHEREEQGLPIVADVDRAVANGDAR